MSLSAADAPVAAADVFAALEATWPPARWHDVPGWRVAEGRGGGKRVSAARVTAPDADIPAMERAQARLSQPPLAMVLPGQEALDAALDAAGYAVIDPTVALAAPVAALCAPLPRLTAFEVAWPPLRVQAELWAAGGIGPGRLDVMARAGPDRLCLLGRMEDRPAGTAFLARHGDIAMVHALEVAPPMRRRGLARHLMTAAARWAAAREATHLAVLVTRANAPALALYRGLGMAEVAGYHYRGREEETP